MIEEDVFVFPASFAQQRLWFIDKLIPGSALYNVATALRLKGILNQVALEQTLNEIVCRHESLRTSFAIVEEELVQVVYPSFNVSVPLVDLQDLPVEQREAEALKILTEESLRPFDLCSKPLWRSLLLQLSSTEHILLLNLHHIICDDWSIGILIKELGKLYTAFCTDGAGDVTQLLPELPLQYADYTEWQQQWLQSVSTNGTTPLKTQLTYWQQQLNNISILNLPTDRPKPAFANYQGETQYLEIPKCLSDALATLSQQEGATLFMTLLAAFKVLLYRYSHQEDIAIGSPIANRNRSEIEGLIGFFVNTLVLRTDLSGNPTFRELLKRVKISTLEAYAHQDLPFEKLVAELHPDRKLNHHPLFQVVFGFENTPIAGLELPNLEVSSLYIENQTTRFDLEFHLWECSDTFRSLWGGDRWQDSEGIRGLVVYNTDLFNANTITRMLAHFKTLLESIVANPEQQINTLQVLSEAERYQLLFAWNETGVDYPKHQCIHELFEQQVEQKPNAIAYVEASPELQITYKELNTRSNQLAHYLQKLGVGAEVIVGLCMEPGVDTIVGLLGILKAGGAYLPLDPSYPRDRLHFMLEDARVTVLLTQSNLLTNFNDKNEKSTNLKTICLDTEWQNIAQERDNNLTINTTGDELAYVIYTSGSTGKPKGVAVPHKAVNRLVCNPNYINIEPTDKIAQISNISFDAATFEIWGALLNGAQLVKISRNIIISPPEFALEISQKNISVLFLTTALFQQIARDIPQAFASLRYLLFGGEKVDPRWVQKVLKNNPPQHLIHVYGPTEGTTFSSYYLVQQENCRDSSYSPILLNNVIPIGRPISNTQIYILDSNLQPVPIGVSGELYIGGEGLARGYLNRPDLTAANFIPNPFIVGAGLVVNSNIQPINLVQNPPLLNSQLTTSIQNPPVQQSQSKIQNPKSKIEQSPKIYKTGDLARYLPDGNIEFLGRIDEQVKIRGFRIELGEIEAVLCQHPEIKEAVAIVTEEIPGDKRIVAYIVTNPNYKILNPKLDDLRQFLKQQLPEYMLPAAIVILESIPLTPNGKVDRKILPTPDTFSINLLENHVAPQTSVEELLVEIWAGVLGLKQIGIYDNFFELGGHSLLATQLTSRIRDTFQIELPVRQVFATPTIAGLAKYIETVAWAKNNLLDNQGTIKEREQIDF